jgi:hypothetical protein
MNKENTGNRNTGVGTLATVTLATVTAYPLILVLFLIRSQSLVIGKMLQNRFGCLFV